MTLVRRSMLTASPQRVPAVPRPARARSAVIRIGVPNEQSGPYTNTGGLTSAISAKQAPRDFDAAGKGLHVEVISPDRQNKPDLAVPIARTRAFTNRIGDKTPRNWTGMVHAGRYSATLHYLKTAHDMGAPEAKKDDVATINGMKAMPADDDCFGRTKIREGGRNLTPAFPFEVRKPSENKGPRDDLKLIATTPGEAACRPLAAGHCSFVRS